MKSRDFDLILIESLSHETKQSFFAENRESFNCNPDEYSKGLMDSFKRLSKETHETDYTRCNITKPNGDVAIGTINNADGEYILSKIGKVSYPDKKIIYIDTPVDTPDKISSLRRSKLTTFCRPKWSVSAGAN